MLGSSGRAARQQQALPDVCVAHSARRVLHPEAAQAHSSRCQQLRRALGRRHDVCQQPLQRAPGPMQGAPAVSDTLQDMPAGRMCLLSACRGLQGCPSEDMRIVAQVLPYRTSQTRE